MNSYVDSYKRIMANIGSSKLGALATSDGNCVTCRTVSLIVHEKAFYFQTDLNSIKAKQISNNSNVAISFEEYEITGEAIMIGHPYSPDARDIYGVYEKLFPSAAKKYGSLMQERLYRIVPKVIKVWKYTDEGAVIELINLHDEKYERILMGY